MNTEWYGSQKILTEPPYTVVCPVCCAAIGGKCLERGRVAGQSYIQTPHPERVELAQERP